MRTAAAAAPHASDDPLGVPSTLQRLRGTRSGMRRTVALLAFALLAAAVPASAAAPSYVIHGDRSVAGLQVARATSADAVARLGAPTSTTPQPPYGCVKQWRPLGLTLAFVDLTARNACRDGVLLRATARSRAHWRTAKGLRVGDPVSRLQRLYPAAKVRPNQGEWTGYWLVVRRTCELGGRHPYPGLLARVQAGRVSAIVSGTLACE
jgi:hypothetical protein